MSLKLMYSPKGCRTIIMKMSIKPYFQIKQNRNIFPVLYLEILTYFQ